ncbi:MAG: hypothetical protein KU37_11505 [Sulfuricurvum sp. PC08-66]|nr:MAG: hypothetical protein KU37_11505 [Sulfuricurvum sp. PC08-66]
MTSHTFEKLAALVKTHSGIHLTEAKRQLVVGRLAKRLRHHNLENFDRYYEVCTSSPDELQIMINTITTNETSFFREQHHFTYMRTHILPHIKTGHLRVWSAAASIGAEAYSIAMVLDEILTPHAITWEVIGTDINTDVVDQANEGLFPMRFAEQIPLEYLKAYCLQGVDTHEGEFIIDDYLRSKVHFEVANLMEPIPNDLGRFDIIFLRNMLIYFDNPAKEHILKNVLKTLKPNGMLFIGHAESIGHLTDEVTQIKPTIYRKGARS